MYGRGPSHACPFASIRLVLISQLEKHYRLTGPGWPRQHVSKQQLEVSRHTYKKLFCEKIKGFYHTQQREAREADRSLELGSLWTAVLTLQSSTVELRTFFKMPTWL